MPLKLPRQSFVALAAIGWADGALKASEGEALLHAASAAGLAGDELAYVERAIKTKVNLAEVEPGSLCPYDRVLTYALATWLGRLDGVVTSAEHKSLELLGERLGLTKHVRERAYSAAFDVAMLPEGGRPDKYDFDKLEERLRAKLPPLK